MMTLDEYENAARSLVSEREEGLRRAGILVEVESEERPEDAYIGSEVRLCAKRIDGTFVGIEEQWIRAGESPLSLDEFCTPLRDFLDELIGG